MHLPSICTTVLFITSSLLHQVLACAPDAIPRQESSDTEGNVTYPFLIPGDDTPANSTTTGYFINHFGLNVRNLTASIDFYNKAFGLRLMFTLQVSKHFSVTYMGHAQGGRNKTGYQTTEELNRDQRNSQGHIEFLHVDAPSWNLPSVLQVPNTFSHIGVIVPDIVATQAHLEDMGANILQPFNQTFALEGAFADAAGLSAIPLSEIDQDERDLIQKVLEPVNTPFIFVADPDGNVLEVQNQT